MTKRYIAILLVLTALLPFGAAAAVAPDDYTDLAEGAWYREAVEFVLENGYMEGIKETEFAPDAVLTRAQALTVLWRMEGKCAGGEWIVPFSDVRTDAWYSDAIQWAYSICLTDGISENKFGTEEYVTRQQVAVWLFRLSGDNPDTKNNLSAFSDEALVSRYAVKAMNWAVGKGLMQARAVDMLEPCGMVSRAEMAQIIMGYVRLRDAVRIPEPPNELA